MENNDSLTDVESWRQTHATTSLADEIYARIRSDIVRGVLRPNSPLVEVELAARLNVSRTPIRESLQHLAADGLIISHRRRWVVYEHSKDEVVEIYEVRSGLESYAARLAALRGTSEQKAAIAEYEHVSASDQGSDRVTTNGHFHKLVNEASNNVLLVEQLRRNRLYHFNYEVAALYTDADSAWSAKQHKEIADAISASDPDSAQNAARLHVEFSLSVIMDRMPQFR